MKRRTRGIILVIILLVGSVWTLVPNSVLEVSASEESQLIELGKKYMPVLKFSADEEFYPRDARVLLEVSYLVCGNHVIESPPVKFENLPSESCVYKQFGALSWDIHYTLDRPFLFPTLKYKKSEVDDFVRNQNIPWPSPEERRDELYEIEKNLGKDYVQYLNGRDDTLALPGISTTKFKLVLLQYWFFYLYDLYSVNAHDGDWEHITVVLLDEGDNLKPIGVYYAYHDGGTFKRWNELEIYKDTHPVVYVGKGSHASYPSKSRLGETFGDDVVLTPDIVKLELINLGEPMWIFDGYWGFYSWTLGIRAGSPPETPTSRDNFKNPLDREIIKDPPIPKTPGISLRMWLIGALIDEIIQISAYSESPLLMRTNTTSITVDISVPWTFIPDAGTLVVKLRDSHGKEVYNVSYYVDLLPGSTKSFTFTWTVPSDAVEGPYYISADIVKDNGSKYYDTLGWQHIFDVVVPEIVQPTTDNPVYVGSKNDPREFPLIVHLGGISKLTSDDFIVTLNGTRATALFVTSDLNGNYYLKVYPPVQKVGGKYDLKVTIKPLGLTLTEDASVIYSETDKANADIELVIDRSGSMSGEKMESAKKAAKDFVNLVQFGDYLGIVSFSSSARVDFPLTNITNESVKLMAIQAIDSIYAGGSTSIGAGLKAALQELVNRGSPNPDYIILMTDGQENTPPYVRDVLPDIKSKGITVYTVGFGSDADAQLLSEIAKETGGIYYFAPTSWDIRAIYQQIAGHVAGKQSIDISKIILFPGKSELRSVYIDPSISSVIFSVSWAGSDVNLTLLTPNGKVITPEIASIDPNITYTKGDTYVSYEIHYPIPGTWTMNITAVDVPESGEEVTTTVLGDTNLTIDLFTEKHTYKQGEPIRLIGVISYSGEFMRGTVNATVRTPSGNVEYLSLSDPEGDGVYEGYYIPSEAGSYTIILNVAGEFEGVPFTRESTLSVYVSSEKMSEGLVSSVDKLEFRTVSGRTLTVYLTLNSTTQDIFRIGVTSLSSEDGVVGLDYKFTPSIASLVPGDTLTVVGNITVPLNATPGVYKGEIVFQGSYSVLTIPIEVKVEPRLQYAPEDVTLYSTDVGVDSIEVYEISKDTLEQITGDVLEVENLRAFVIASTGFGNFKLKISNVTNVKKIKVFRYDFENKKWKQISFEVGSVILPLSVDGFNVDVIVLGETTPTQKEESEESYTNIIVLSQLWTTWFFNYYDEFNELYANATALGIDNETLQKALELHNNATELMKQAWKTDSLEDIRAKLWKEIKILPKVADIRKAFLDEREAAKILKEAIEKAKKP